MEEKIKAEVADRGDQPVKVLNLFAYTGGASLIAARAGAEVTHVDASSVSVLWARKNAELSNLADAKIRWITDDVLQFLRREVRRKNTYDVVIMDPPSFGHGPKGTLWKIEKDFYELMDLVRAVLSDSPVALILNGYTAGYSQITLKNNLIWLVEQHKGVLEAGELGVSENMGRTLSSGVFARWSNQ